jgi:hypothetical protein
LNTEGLSGRLREPVFDRLERLAAELTLVDDDDDDDDDDEDDDEEDDVVNRAMHTGADDSRSTVASPRRRTPSQLQARLLEFYDCATLHPTLRAMSSRVDHRNDAQAVYTANVWASPEYCPAIPTCDTSNNTGVPIRLCRTGKRRLPSWRRRASSNRDNAG